MLPRTVYDEFLNHAGLPPSPECQPVHTTPNTMPMVLQIDNLRNKIFVSTALPRPITVSYHKTREKGFESSQYGCTYWFGSKADGINQSQVAENLMNPPMEPARTRLCN